MSRPKPTVLLEYINQKTYKVEQILDSEAIWAVFYQEKPFNLKSSNLGDQPDFTTPAQVSFSNPGHAHNLAKKLNELFDTDEFIVCQLTTGTIVTENE